MGKSYSSSIGSQKGVQNLEGLTAGELTVFLSEGSEDSCQYRWYFELSSEVLLLFPSKHTRAHTRTHIHTYSFMHNVT